MIEHRKDCLCLACEQSRFITIRNSERVVIDEAVKWFRWFFESAEEKPQLESAVRALIAARSHK